MIRVFLFILFIIISNKLIASIQGETLICDKDKRGYNFISKDKVEALGINFEKRNIISINYKYELTENAIFIKQPQKEIDKEKTHTPIGWIFRRSLDYVSLSYVNGDWGRKFLWSCEIISTKQLEKRLKNKLIKFIKKN